MTTYANADSYVGEQVHMELFRRRWTRRELARRLGITEQSLGRKVNGISTFTLDELLLISRLLDRQVTDLLPGQDYSPTPGRSRSIVHLETDGAPAANDEGTDDECANRDLNPEPAGLKYRTKRAPFQMDLDAAA